MKRMIIFIFTAALLTACENRGLSGLYMIDEITNKGRAVDLSELYSMNIMGFKDGDIIDPPSFKEEDCGQCSWVYLDHNIINIKCSSICWFEGNWEFTRNAASDSNKTIFMFRSDHSSFRLSR